MGNNKDDKDMEKSVYEEWRTYPPVPEVQIKTQTLSDCDKSNETNDRNLSDGQIKKQDG